MVGTQRFITTGCNSAPGRIPRLILGLERLTDLGGRFFANGAHSTAHERAQLHCSSVWSMHSPKRTYTAAAHAGPVIADEDASRHFRYGSAGSRSSHRMLICVQAHMSVRHVVAGSFQRDTNIDMMWDIYVSTGVSSASIRAPTVGKCHACSIQPTCLLR